ncbi:kinase-like domain-containing protein [Apiospora saccharicola]
MPSLGFLKKKRTREDKSEPSTSQPTSPVTPITPTSARPFDNSLSHTSTRTTTGSSLSHTHTKSTSGSYSGLNETQSPASAGVGSPMNSISGQQQTPFGIQHTPSPSHAGTPQSLPSINNLIYPNNQTDGAGNNGAPPVPQHHVPSPRVPHHQATLSEARVTKGKYSLGDFDMLRTLGTGSFGRVHLVQSKHNQRYYAIKVLKKAQVVKMKQVEHTNDERKMLSEVKHPFLITLWGTFFDCKNIYMVMDFVEGGELFSLLRKSGRLGNLYGGPQDVKNHPWFAEVTWDRLLRKDIDAPYTPPVKAGAGDASQFDRYPEEQEKYGQEGNDE